MDEGSSTGRMPPAPDQDPTAVLEWPSIVDESMVSPVQWVLLRRTEFLAAQNRLLLQGMERLLMAGNKRSRRSSASSAGSGATESTEGDPEITAADTDSINNPAITEAYNSLIDVENDKHAAVVEAHRAFMDQTNNKVYVKRTILSTKAAMAFREYIGTVFVGGGDEVDEGDLRNSIASDFALLNPDLVTNVFISVNKGLKKSKSKGKKKVEASGEASGEVSGEASGQTPREGTPAGQLHSSPLPVRGARRRSARSSRPSFILSSDHEDANDDDNDEGGGATTPRAPQQYAASASASLRQISNTTSGGDESQVSLTSVELRRSNQQLRFEEGNEDDDDYMQG
ncbi:unnamed protein product [Fusarium equiseti]|uniref:Uncharacterized protein n=1 Tax=Fusarium equiseti TaxID=61235 RepID=A0A8J2IP69_FUSEQ|nr:unnamed protein product [Fusarium equiseti]